MQNQEIFDHESLKRLGLKSTYQTTTFTSVVNKPKLYFYTNTVMVPPFCNFFMLTWKTRKLKWLDQVKDYFIDPGIEDLPKFGDYQKKDEIIAFIEKAEIPNNCHITLDYPVFFGKDDKQKEQFRNLSRENNFKWAKNSNYLCVIQPLKFEATEWIKEYDYLSPIFENNKSKVLGIGGLLPIVKPCPFTHDLFDYLLHNAEKLNWIHFYGMGLALCERYLPSLIKKGVKISVDHTKWCRCDEEISNRFKYFKYPQADAAVGAYLKFIQKLRYTFEVVH